MGAGSSGLAVAKNFQQAQIAFDVLGNLRSEFWPDVKNKLLRRKP